VEFENGFLAAEVTKKSFVITDADIVTGRGKGIPRDVEPGGGGQELVGKLPVSEEVDQCLELRRVFRTNVGSLTDEVLGVLNAAHLAIHGLAAEAGIDDDRAHDKPGRLQQLMTAVGHVDHSLHRGDVRGVFLQIQKLAQPKMLRQLDIIEILFHGFWL
jgi:hypothetical protein